MIVASLASAGHFLVAAAEEKSIAGLLQRHDLFQPLTEPPCSYCSNQDRKNLINRDDRVIAWIRGAHNGGAVPIRHFLSAPRVINDTYGLFFYDPDGGYVAAYKKDYGYKFYGWLNGVMIVEGRDGTLWSALRGEAIKGPLKGSRLERIPSFVTDWGYWNMLHPESTTYDLFDGKKYPQAALPTDISADARGTIGKTDPRLDTMANVLGVEIGGVVKAFPLDNKIERACYMDEVGGEKICVFWYAPTHTAVAFSTGLDDKNLTFYADDISPETAPMKDKETGTRWTLAGRGVDGSLRGSELHWINSIQCRWYAWSAEYPDSGFYSPSTSGHP
ncbi:MAG: DUF3179 domain-containing protein [Candidatus Hydrogenedentes bacterium]|nr:DUF3179 domain-containing protein [Candidatus Hydrogenedentota bacterium]